MSVPGLALDREQGVIRDWIAESRLRLGQLRVLTLETPPLMETVGNWGTHTEIQAIEIAAPATVQWIRDKAVQVHGASGLSRDFSLAEPTPRSGRCASPTGRTRCTRTCWGAALRPHEEGR